MKVELINVDKLIPYASNPRLTAPAVDKVAASIKKFGFRQPIVVDGEMVIIVGHVRHLAAQKLGLKKVPVHVADNLTPAEVKAYLKGVLMPVVATRDFQVVNGIGRLQMQAEQKKKEVAVVFVTEAEARLADAMLNLLSMDFDIHNRYRDLLRYNSFRRLRRVREDLGRGFIRWRISAFSLRSAPALSLCLTA